MDIEQTCLISPLDLIELKHRGALYVGVKNEYVYFYINKNSTFDDEEKLRTLREYLKNKYSYTLKIAMR